MAAETFAQVAKRRLLGLLLIALVVGLVSLSIAIYEKVFTATDTITLRADHTGNQLILDSDVKVNGLIVGSVSEVNADGDNAVVTMAIEPDKMKDIPGNVKAVILPKTLFGEQYVSLVIPADQPDGAADQGRRHDRPRPFTGSARSPGRAGRFAAAAAGGQAGRAERHPQRDRDRAAAQGPGARARC